MKGIYFHSTSSFNALLYRSVSWVWKSQKRSFLLKWVLDGVLEMETSSSFGRIDGSFFFLLGLFPSSLDNDIHLVKHLINNDETEGCRDTLSSLFNALEVEVKKQVSIGSTLEDSLIWRQLSSFFPSTSFSYLPSHETLLFYNSIELSLSSSISWQLHEKWLLLEPHLEEKKSGKQFRA